MPSRSTREYGTPTKRTTLSSTDQAAREKQRAAKLRKKPTRSAFDVADEQAQKSTDAYRPARMVRQGKGKKDPRGGLIGQAQRDLAGRKEKLKEAEKKSGSR